MSDEMNIRKFMRSAMKEVRGTVQKAKRPYKMHKTHPNMEIKKILKSVQIEAFKSQPNQKTFHAQIRQILKIKREKRK